MKNLNEILFKINQSGFHRLTPFLAKLGLHWNDGFDFEATKEEEELDESKMVLGAGENFPIINESGDWTDFWPKDERQSGVIDTFSCTLFGLFNDTEALAKYQYNDNTNWSERFNAGMVKIRRYSGYTMTGALDSVRKLHGAVSEELYPNNIENVSWEDWVRKAPKEIQEVAKEFFKIYDLRFKQIPATMAGFKQGLKISPLYVAGSAWARNSRGEYYSFSNPNHVFGIKRIEDGRLIAGDTYEPFEKTLSQNFRIFFPKVLKLTKREEKSELDKLKDKGFRFVMRPEHRGEFYIIENGQIKHLKTKEEIKNAIVKYTDLSPDILELARKNVIKFATEEYFEKLS